MKQLLGRFIHLIIMPCSHVPMLVEQENAGLKLPWVKRLRLRMHLSMCKACVTYTQKVEYMDRMMAKRYMETKNNNKFEESEIEEFKQDLKNRITPYCSSSCQDSCFSPTIYTGALHKGVGISKAIYNSIELTR